MRIEQEGEAKDLHFQRSAHAWLCPRPIEQELIPAQFFDVPVALSYIVRKAIQREHIDPQIFIVDTKLRSPFDLDIHDLDKGKGYIIQLMAAQFIAVRYAFTPPQSDQPVIVRPRHGHIDVVIPWDKIFVPDRAEQGPAK